MDSPADRNSNNWDTLKDTIQISRPYFLTAMIKIPSVFAKNGINRSIMVILVLGGLCSTLSNMIVAKLCQKTRDEDV